MKKILSLLLALCLVVPYCLNAFATDSQTEYSLYLTSDKESATASVSFAADSSQIGEKYSLVLEIYDEFGELLMSEKVSKTVVDGENTATITEELPLYAVTAKAYVADKKGNPLSTVITDDDLFRSIKILTLGHSYGVDANWFLPNILKEAGYDEVVIGVIFRPGCSINSHYNEGIMFGEMEDSHWGKPYYHKNITGDSADWKNRCEGVDYDFSGNGGKKANYIDAFTDEDWDIIAMQESPSGSGLPESDGYNAVLPELIDWIHEHKTNPDAKLAWHMTWASEQFVGTVITNTQGFNGYKWNQMAMYNGIVEAVKTRVMPTGEFDYLIPVGTVIQNMRYTYLGDNLTADGVHLDRGHGCYAAALTWAKVLGNINLEESKYLPDADTCGTQRGGKVPDKKFQETAKDAIYKAIEAPYQITPNTIQTLLPKISVDFGEAIQNGDSYTYTATVYLENYHSLYGMGATHDEENKTVTANGDYSGKKIRDWNLNIQFKNPSDFVSMGEASSSLKVIDGYSGGEATYIAPDMSESYNGGTLKITSRVGNSAKKAYPYYGRATGEIALGTFKFTTNTDNFKVNLSANIQLGETAENGEFVGETALYTYASDNFAGKAENNKSLAIEKAVKIGIAEAADNPNDGLITSEAELRAALAAPLSTDKNNPTKIVLGADIILDDGAMTADDLTDGKLEITGTETAPVYVDISGDYTIKNMQKMTQNKDATALFSMQYATVNITDTVIDANYGNDAARPKVDKTYGITPVYVWNGNLTLNGTATIKNGHVNREYCPSAVRLYGNKSTVSFTMNDDSMIIGCKRYDTYKGSGALIETIGSKRIYFTMNGGEISGNELSEGGVFNRDNNNTNTTELNAGKIINNDCTKMLYLIKQGNSGRTFINGSGMTFDEGMAKFMYNGGSGNYFRVTAPLTQKIAYLNSAGGLNESGGVRPIFAGDGYTLTLSDLQMAATEGGMASRVVALNTAMNMIYSCTSIADVPKGYILADGTVVSGDPVTSNSIYAIENGTVGAEVLGQTVVKYDNVYVTQATFAGDGRISGAGVLFIPKKVLGGINISQIKHGLTIGGKYSVANAYDDAPTIIEDGATIEIIAALKDIPRIFDAENALVLYLRPYVSIDGRYIYAKTPTEVTIDNIN